MNYRTTTDERPAKSLLPLLQAAPARLSSSWKSLPGAIREILDGQRHWVWVAVPLTILAVCVYQMITPVWFGYTMALCLQPLVPLVVGWAIYQQRQDAAFAYAEFLALYPADSPRRRGSLGIVLLGGFLIFGALISTFTIVSVIGLVVIFLGIAYYLYGAHIFRFIWQPLCYLVLMIPPPISLIERLSGLLQVESAVVTSKLLQIFSSGTHASGVMIVLPGYSFEVSPQISGMNVILPVLFLTAFLALLKHMDLSWSGILMIASIVISLTVNTLRIILIGLIGAANPMVGETLRSVYSIVFVALSFYLTYLLANLILRGPRRRLTVFERDLMEAVLAAEEDAAEDEDTLD